MASTCQSTAAPWMSVSESKTANKMLAKHRSERSCRRLFVVSTRMSILRTLRSQSCTERSKKQLKNRWKRKTSKSRDRPRKKSCSNLQLQSKKRRRCLRKEACRQLMLRSAIKSPTKRMIKSTLDQRPRSHKQMDKQARSENQMTITK